MDKVRKKAHFWAQIIGRLPGVAAVFLSGSLAQGRAKSTSDIDFFIITYSGCIWTARFWTNLILKLTFNLSKPKHHQARICPNHFITANSLEIVEQDAYSAHLFSHNQALYDPHHLWPDFVKANDWVHEFGEAFPVLVETVSSRSRAFELIEKAKPSSGEKLLRMIQMAKIKRNPDFKLPGAKIILKDTELRFHPDPKNQYWQQAEAVDLGKRERQEKVDIVTSES